MAMRDSVTAHERCPNCGTPLPSDPGSEGLCPQCLLSLALLDAADESPTAVRGFEDLPGEASEGPAPGQILGDRYQIREAFGRGAMGEA